MIYNHLFNKKRKKQDNVLYFLKTLTLKTCQPARLWWSASRRPERPPQPRRPAAARRPEHTQQDTGILMCVCVCVSSWLCHEYTWSGCVSHLRSNYQSWSGGSSGGDSWGVSQRGGGRAAQLNSHQSVPLATGAIFHHCSNTIIIIIITHRPAPTPLAARSKTIIVSFGS